MLDKMNWQIISESLETGWVLEPDAKQLMEAAGLDIPDFVLTDDPEKAISFFNNSSGLVVAKAVSEQIVHKTEYNAVRTRISSGDILKQHIEELLDLPGCKTVLIEEMVQGIEIIAGAKNDYQFGTVIILGLGGTAVEIYNDTAIRLAPLKAGDIDSMVQSLTASRLIKGYRGQKGINMEKLTDMMIRFSHLAMELEPYIESIDLNPVICNSKRCAIADARIMLNQNQIQ